jgi:hypothetical protein
MEISRTWSSRLKLCIFWTLLTAVGWTVGMAVVVDYDLSGAALFIGFLILGIALGLGQWLVLLSKRLGAGWEKGAGWWILSTVLGFTAGFFVLVLLNTIRLGVISLATYGAVVGLAQWFVLRRRVRMSGWWIPATVIGWLIAMAVGLAVFWQGVIFGGVTGVTLVLLPEQINGNNSEQIAAE